MPGEQPPKRALTHLGHNEDRSVRLPVPRGVGLTEPPTPMPGMVPIAKIDVVPRKEFDFDQRTPPAMDSDTWHALQTLRSKLDPVEAILEIAKQEREAREARELREEAERKRKYTIAVITAIGAALTGIIVALHGCG